MYKKVTYKSGAVFSSVLVEAQSDEEARMIFSNHKPQHEIVGVGDPVEGVNSLIARGMSVIRR